MPILKDPRHERFAQLLASGRTPIDGYKEAGHKRNTGDGPALARTEETVRGSSTRQAGAQVHSRHGFRTDGR
jgi:hypothetical protein